MRQLFSHLPLADEGLQFVGGEIHAVEVGQQVATRHLLDAQADLSGGTISGIGE